MPMVEGKHFKHFLLYVFVLILPFFAIWGVLSSALVTPLIGLVNILLSNWLPDVVNAVYQQGADMLLITRFDQVNGQWVPADSSGSGLGFRMNTRIVSYSIPFYAALHFATDRKNVFTSFFWGLLVIYPFIWLGMVSMCLKELMVGFGSTFIAQTGAAVPAQAVVGITYQLSVIIIPTLIPIIVWAWQSQEFILRERSADFRRT